jgi:glycine/D-amino acid oxidase-like deaminating enzyme
VDVFWLEEPGPPIPRTRLAARAEVEIVGGGATGCACALALAARGVRVRLHEARGIAEGASGRNGGFALRGGAAPYGVTAELIGRERARELWQLTERYLERLAELGGDAVERTGSLRLAADGEERDELRADFEAMSEDGFAVEWRDELEPPLAGRVVAALFHPPDAAIQPARLTRRLAVAAAEAGAELHEHSRVASLDELEADRIVVATDGYPSGLLGELEGLIIPTRGQMIATEPVAERLFECPHYSRGGLDYWHQRSDGRILAGGFRDVSLASEFTADEETTSAVQDALEGFVAHLVGRPVRVTHRWAGIFGMVLDFLPVVGRVPGSDRLWVSGGYSGHGNVLGPLCGELLAQALLGEAAALLELFDPARLLQVDARNGV